MRGVVSPPHPARLYAAERRRFIAARRPQDACVAHRPHPSIPGASPSPVIPGRVALTRHSRANHPEMTVGGDAGRRRRRRRAAMNRGRSAKVGNPGWHGASFGVGHRRLVSAPPSGGDSSPPGVRRTPVSRTALTRRSRARRPHPSIPGESSGDDGRGRCGASPPTAASRDESRPLGEARASRIARGIARRRSRLSDGAGHRSAKVGNPGWRGASIGVGHRRLVSPPPSGGDSSPPGVRRTPVLRTALTRRSRARCPHPSIPGASPSPVDPGRIIRR